MINPNKLFGRLGNRMFQMAYIASQIVKREIPDEWLQDEKYFAGATDFVRRMYMRTEGEIAYEPYVSIHVRRGDYVDNAFYVDLTKPETDYDLGGSYELPSYYEQAMKEFPGAKFLVFSDDIEWCMEQPLFHDCFFSQGLSEVDDMNRMMACEGHVIANSTFSWWAAWLSQKKTVAPSRWYTDSKMKAPSFPKQWIKI